MAKNFFARHKYWTAFGVLVVIGAIIGIVFAVIYSGSSDTEEEVQERTFTIDHDKNTFLKDGKPFQYMAGSFHYFRALPDTWRHKLKTIRAAGLNAVDMYVHWALHNPHDGFYNWDEIADLEQALKIAQEEDLVVILRPGPYICAELDNGGLPYWLASKYPNIKVRTNDVDYLREIGKWYSMLMPRLEKHFYGNGGSIIMVQIENEYGAYGVCDAEYKNFLRDETLKYTNGKAVLFTVDRPIDSELQCGFIENVFVTIDFGVSNSTQIDSYIEKLRKIQPTGPLVNTEFYTGWFTRWQENNSRRNIKDLVATLELMLVKNFNIDFYMFFGGTNFGFWAGASENGIGRYMADITSYDYDAPMDEAGNPTDKYLAIRNKLEEHLDVPDESTIPEKVLTMALTAVIVKPVDSIFSTVGRSTLGTRSFLSSGNRLPRFEELKQFSGFVLYETTLPKLTRDPTQLIVSLLRDRALVYIDDEYVGALSRENYINTLPISADYGSKLSILVENQGRINWDYLDDYKGILGTVQVESFEGMQTLGDWTVTGYSFDNYVDVENFVRVSNGNYQISSDGNLYDGPVVFHGEFEIGSMTPIQDTYWDCQGWGKGFVFVNGFNIGRYWPLVGPQITMYIPKDLLKHGHNHIVVVELQKAPPNTRMSFVSGPIFINEQQV